MCKSKLLFFSVNYETLDFMSTENMMDVESENESSNSKIGVENDTISRKSIKEKIAPIFNPRQCASTSTADKGN